MESHAIRQIFGRIDGRVHRARPARAGNGESGQAFVEFALVTPLLLTIVFAAIGFGNLFWKHQQLSAATSEGARRAIVSRNDPNREQTIVDATRNAAPNLDESDLDVNVTSSWTPGSTVSVTATFPVEVNILGMTLYDDDIESTRTMRVEQ